MYSKWVWRKKGDGVGGVEEVLWGEISVPVPYLQGFQSNTSAFIGPFGFFIYQMEY